MAPACAQWARSLTFTARLQVSRSRYAEGKVAPQIRPRRRRAADGAPDRSLQTPVAPITENPWPRRWINPSRLSHSRRASDHPQNRASPRWATGRERRASSARSAAGQSRSSDCVDGSACWCLTERRLADVVWEFNRQNSKPLVIESDPICCNSESAAPSQSNGSGTYHTISAGALRRGRSMRPTTKSHYRDAENSDENNFARRERSGVLACTCLLLL